MYCQPQTQLCKQTACGLFIAILMLVIVSPDDAFGDQEEYCDGLRRSIVTNFVDLRAVSRRKERSATVLNALLQLHEIGGCPKDRLNKILVCVNDGARDMLKEQGAVESRPLLSVASQCLKRH